MIVNNFEGCYCPQTLQNTSIGWGYKSFMANNMEESRTMVESIDGMDINRRSVVQLEGMTSTHYH